MLSAETASANVCIAELNFLLTVFVVRYTILSVDHLFSHFNFAAL